MEQSRADGAAEFVGAMADGFEGDAGATHTLWRMLWCMRRTNIYLEDRQTEALDRLAVEEGISRAELIRRILDRALQGHDGSLAVDLARLDLAFGRPLDIDLPSREPDARGRYLAELTGGDA